MTKEDIICKVKDEYDTLMKNRDLTRMDILNAFEHLIKVLTLKETPAPVKNCMRVYYRRNKNSEVESVECYALISVGHIGNNHYECSTIKMVLKNIFRLTSVIWSEWRVSK